MTAAAPPRRLRVLLALTRLALWWEAAWPLLWRPVAICGAFAAVALLDLLPLLPGWLHAAALAGFAAALAASAWPLARLRWPARDAARCRLERDSGLAHRPLGALEDRLAAGDADPVAAALWRRHLARLRERMPPVALRLPSPGMAGHEPWGLRAGVLLMLVIGLAVGARDAGPRLGRALSPAVGGSGAPVTVEAWIRPPAYTGLPPVFLRTPAGDAAAPAATAAATEVPRGSTVVVRAWPLARPPRLEIGGEQRPFAPLAGAGEAGDAAYAAEAPLEAGDAIVVRDRRRELVRWPVRIRADAPPTAAFTGPPQPDDAGRLRLGYEVHDDYRVTGLAVAIRPADRVDAAPLRVTVPVAETAGAQGTGSHLADLADHEWAGRPVRLVLEATDGAGQTGHSSPLEAVLPERVFHHPVALEVIAARKRLLDPDGMVRLQAGIALVIAGGRPERFGHDTVVSLALAAATARLRYDPSAGAARSLRPLLWQVALRIEDGDVPAARDALTEAGRALSEALRDGAPAETVERLMAALRDALGRYLDAVAAEARRADAGADGAADPAGLLPTGDLGALFEHADRLIGTGAHAAAGRLLDQLMQMIAGVQTGAGAARLRQQLREERALLDALRGLADDQQRLLDEVFRRSGERGRGAEPRRGEPRDRAGQNQPSQNPEERDRAHRDHLPRDQARAAASRQRRLHDRLHDAIGEAGRGLGQAPAPLGDADRAMGEAGAALDRGAAADAIDAQGSAVDALRRAEAALRQAFAERRAGQGGMLLFGGRDGGGGFGADPFGRQPGDGGGGFGLGRIAIPDAGELGRAQAIVDELRRRAGEPHRPSPERDYIERLLRRF